MILLLALTFRVTVEVSVAIVTSWTLADASEGTGGADRTLGCRVGIST